MFAESARGNALYGTSIQATLSINSGGTELIPFSFVDDDGAGPGTTAFVDPATSVGSTADAAGSVNLTEVDSGVFGASASTSGIASGFFPSITTSAFSSAQAGGGFSLVNPTDSNIEVSLLLTWNWSIDLLADNSTLDLALAQVGLTLLENGIPIDILVDSLLATPNDVTGADSFSSTRTVSIAANGEASYAILVSTSGLGQSQLPNAVSEPGSIVLIIVGVCAFSRRCYFNRTNARSMRSGSHLKT